MSNIPTYDSHTVAVYANHYDAESAVRQLSTIGYDMKRLSIIGQNYHTEERPIGFVNIENRMCTWGKYGAFWGAIWGLLFGSAFLIMPGIGQVLLAGYIVTALEGAAFGGGLGILGGALSGLGVAKDSLLRYETDLKADSFILIVHGDEAEVKRAEEALASTRATRLDTYATGGILARS